MYGLVEGIWQRWESPDGSPQEVWGLGPRFQVHLPHPFPSSTFYWMGSKGKGEGRASPIEAEVLRFDRPLRVF